MPRGDGRAGPCAASAAASGGSPGSTVSAATRPPCSCAQACASRVNAMLWAPPDTATGRRGAGSNGAKAPISAAKSAAWSGAVLIGRSAGEPLLLVGGALLDVARRAREVAVEPGEGTAGIRLLPELAQGHAELEQVVGSLPALWIFLIALGEDRGGVVVVLPRVLGLAPPVLGGTGERIVGGALDEGAQVLLGRRG